MLALDYDTANTTFFMFTPAAYLDTNKILCQNDKFNANWTNEFNFQKKDSNYQNKGQNL